MSVLPPQNEVRWNEARRIISSRFPPIDLFEDIADPRDWDLIASAEAKTNPRMAEHVGQLDLVPPERRVSGPGARRHNHQLRQDLAEKEGLLS